MPSGPIRKLPAGGGWRVYVSLRTRIQPNQTPRACWAPCAGLGPSHRRLRFSVFTRRGCGPAAPTLHGAAAASRICRGRVDVRGDDSLDLVESAFGSVLERRGGAQKDHRLIQTGPYRLVRHPLYAGIILASVGVALCVTTWSSLLGIALLVTCFEHRAHTEDAFHASGVGAEFEAYRERTGRMVPRLG